MRIAIRLWLALLITIVLVLGTGVLIRVREEQRLLLEVTLRDRQFFASVLATSLSPEHGAKDPLREAQAILSQDNVSGAHIEARLISLSPAPNLPRPLLPRSALAPVARGEVVAGTSGDQLVTYVPLGSRDAAIELVEPHAVATVLARIGWRSLWMQASVLAMLAGLVTFVLVHWLVGAPLTALTALARAIGKGELSARASRSHRTDEVATLGREMNGMAQALEQARKALDDLDAERVAALEQLRHADRLRTVGQLASALAHELGTPLNVVSGHARIIEQQRHLDEEARSSARTILEQAQRMTRILKDLLGFVRRTPRQREEQDLSALAHHAARTLEPLARRHGVQIVVDADGSPSVTADGQHLLQVITNLLTNAMHAMKNGGQVSVQLHECDAEPPIGVHASPGRYVRMSVSDSGVGIDVADLPHLFEPFFTRKAADEGTGLGLSVVQGIVKEHGGWVSVTSENGKGSRFDVYLPCNPPT